MPTGRRSARARVLFSGNLQRFFGRRWCDDHFDKLAGDDGLRGFSIQLAVKTMMPRRKSGRFYEGAIVSVENRGTYRHAARVSVLDVTQAGSLNDFRTLQRRVGIGDVVVEALCPEPVVRWPADASFTFSSI